MSENEVTDEKWERFLKEAMKEHISEFRNYRYCKTRKRIESWMMVPGVPPFKVYQRQGHDPETSLYHYQGLSFTDLEIDQIKKG